MAISDPFAHVQMGRANHPGYRHMCKCAVDTSPALAFLFTPARMRKQVEAMAWSWATDKRLGTLAIGDWMGSNGLQFNSRKTEWLWAFGPSGVKVFPLFVLDGMTMLHLDPVCNLEVLL